MNALRGDDSGRGAGAQERAGAAPRDALLALDPWLLFLLGMLTALQVTGDPAFSTLGKVSRWDGEVLRTVLAVGAVATLLLFLTAAMALPGGVERRSYRTFKRATLAALGVLIVALPMAFLLILSALHSPYLDAFHETAGEVFLLAMLAVMAAGYLWMRRLLELPGLQRVRLTDA